MCGIAGFCLSPDEHVDATVLAQRLLLSIEERGRHATGAAYFDGSTAFVQKDPIPASAFVPGLGLPRHARTAILHTRWATQGSPKDNANNHPIDVGGVVGVHNGCVYNDDALFDRLPEDVRIAEVDSEAIFATVLYGAEPIGAALGRVLGSAAVAWIDSDGDPQVLHCARISSSPFVYAFTEAGSFVFASTEKALRSSMRAAGMVLSGGPYTLPEGTYLKVRSGSVVGKQTFDRADGGVRRALTATERRALNLA